MPPLTEESSWRQRRSSVLIWYINHQKSVVKQNHSHGQKSRQKPNITLITAIVIPWFSYSPAHHIASHAEWLTLQHTGMVDRVYWHFWLNLGYNVPFFMAVIYHTNLYFWSEVYNVRNSHMYDSFPILSWLEIFNKKWRTSKLAHIYQAKTINSNSHTSLGTYVCIHYLPTTHTVHLLPFSKSIPRSQMPQQILAGKYFSWFQPRQRHISSSTNWFFSEVALLLFHQW